MVHLPREFVVIHIYKGFGLFYNKISCLDKKNIPKIKILKNYNKINKFKIYYIIIKLHSQQVT